MSIPEGLRYTKEHEWARIAGPDEVVVGITHHAQDELGDVVFVDLPKIGDAVTQAQSFGAVESVKAVSDLYAPVSGTVIRVNQEVIDKPELINSDPYGQGWLIAVKMKGSEELRDLMDAAGYAEYVAEEAGSH